MINLDDPRDSFKIAMRIIIVCAALYAYHSIIPIHLRDFILGGIILVMGIYLIFRPLKKVKGIRHEYLPAYSKKFGALCLPCSGYLIFHAIDTNTDLIKASPIVYVLLLLIAAFSAALMIVLQLTYRKKSKDAANNE